MVKSPSKLYVKTIQYSTVQYSTVHKHNLKGITVNISTYSSRTQSKTVALWHSHYMCDRQVQYIREQFNNVTKYFMLCYKKAEIFIDRGFNLYFSAFDEI